MDAEVSTHTFLTMIIYLFYVVWTNFFCNYSYVVHTEYIFISIFINWTVHMSDNLPEKVQILGHTHIICITVREDRIICCQIFCDLLLKSAFERIFNVMQLILVKIKWYIKWKYLIQKFHDICLSYYFNWKEKLNIKIFSMDSHKEVAGLNWLIRPHLNPTLLLIRYETRKWMWTINKKKICTDLQKCHLW